MKPADNKVLVELEALEGLLPLALDELHELGFPAGKSAGATAATFTLPRLDAAAHARLGRSRLAVAHHQVLTFAVPRPKALLGDQHLRRLTAALQQVSSLGGHTSFRLSAAGADSAVFRRLIQELHRTTGLAHDPDEGGLLMRVRRERDSWQVLLRLTDRPLSARDWRVCNMEGGLNAGIAAAMNRLLQSGTKLNGSYLNAMCGSGTLMAEWCAVTGQPATGLDTSVAALECAGKNLSGWAGKVTLLEADATDTPFADASFAFIASDPPWGDDIGSNDENARLYPAFLKEAARLLVPGGRLALLSHELKLTGKLLSANTDFRTLTDLRVWHGGHRPGIWLLEKK